MANLTPYLFFHGNCSEAMEYYVKNLNATIEYQGKFSEGPMEVPENWKDKVMHCTLKIEGQVLMASDSMPDQDVNRGNGFSLSLDLNDIELAKKYFSNLSNDGGHVIMEIQETFWGATFGMLTDKFGIQWMFNIEKEQN